MSYEIKGTVLRVNPTVTKKEKYRSRELVLTIEDPKYPQTLAFETTGDRCDSLDQYQAGDVVKVAFDLRGREWNGPNGVRVFNTLALWKVEVLTKADRSASTARGSDDDSLPF